MPPMRKVLLMIALVACGSNSNNNVDAPMPDRRPVLALDCTTYCNTIQGTCTAANAQYSDMAHCTAACAEFTPGAASTETSGNTLGCRIYHAQNAMLNASDPAMVATHCPHAGPVGAKVDAATGVCGDPCVDFCALDAKVCGTTAAPVTGVTNRYADVATCMTACTGFDKTVAFSATAP